jgi:hypothetical protein
VYGDVPPVDVAVKVIVFPFPWLEGSEGDDDKLGIPSAGFIIKVEEYPDETVFVPESVTTTFASSGLFDVSVEVVWKV